MTWCTPAVAERQRVVVVGAGIGGLVAALLLASRGLEVTLVEAAGGPGGKMRPLVVDGEALDAGPTVFTMRWVLDELLDEIGTSAAASLPPLVPLSVLARHAWGDDGSRLDLYADQARSQEAIAQFAGPAEAARFQDFCKRAAHVYRTLEGPHIRSSRPSFGQMVADLGPRGLATLAALGPMASLARALTREFRDPRLRQLFGRYATYCGASPFAAPATLMLVAHVEQQGVWAVQGGMAALAGALAALAAARGVRLRYGVRCEAIEHAAGRASGVRLEGGERLAADAVVFNGDVSALAALLPAMSGALPRPAPPRGRTLSAVTWALRVRSAGFGLDRHNVFFDGPPGQEFDDVFRKRRLPARGTVYLCAQDRPAAGAALPGPERLLMLVNAPPDGDQRSFDDTEITECQTRCLQLLRRCGLELQLDRPSQLQVRTPADFNRLYPATGGALYGPSTHGWMALFRRSGSATALPGLYLAGGSVHPGPGVPMAAMSGRLAAATLMAHLGSTARSSRVRMAGGTSMPSATTAATR
jgi:1-hydroxycarotenoid 3,4-desaturase